MNHIHNRLKNGTSGGQLGEFAHIAYEHGNGENALGKIVQVALTWCSEERVVNYAETLPSKLVVTMMKIFKKL
jgi:hypothetical protein